MRVVITTTWNSIDVISIFLLHYRRMGFDRVVVMDFDSTDGTMDVLRDSRWKGLVSVFPFPGLAGLDSSNLMLNHAKMEYPPHTLCLFCDPDELLVLPLMDICKDAPFDLSGDGVSGWILPRSNMTCKRSLAIEDQSEMHALGALQFRARGMFRKDTVALIKEDRLEPAWIFTQLPGKVLFRLSDTISVGDGDHTAITQNSLRTAPEGVYILHYPFRSFQAFEKKIMMAKRDFATNTNFPQSYGWQLRRWIRLAERGLLFPEYLEQFPNDDDFCRLVTEESLRQDKRVVDFHAHHTMIG